MNNNNNRNNNNNNNNNINNNKTKNIRDAVIFRLTKSNEYPGKYSRNTALF